MNNEKFQFFSQRIWTHRISITEAGWILGFAPEDVSVLVGYKILNPIGKPAQNSPILASERFVFSAKEFASLFGRHPSWTYRQIDAGKINYILKFGQIMIPRYRWIAYLRIRCPLSGRIRIPKGREAGS